MLSHLGYMAGFAVVDFYIFYLSKYLKSKNFFTIAFRFLLCYLFCKVKNLF